MAEKRILIVTERFYPEEFLINDLAKELTTKQFHVEVLTQTPSYPFDKIYEGYRNTFFSSDEYEGVLVHRVFTFLGYKSSTKRKILGYLIFAFLTWIKAFSIAKSFDIIFFYHTGPATMAHSAFIFKKVFKKKCVIWTQDIWPDTVFASGVKETKIRRLILEKYLRRLYKNFDNVLVSCEGFIPIIKNYYKLDVRYCPQWYPGNDLGPFSFRTSGKIQFTFLGNIGSVQNLENVCYGFINALKSGISAQLNIVGDGVYFKTIQNLVKKYDCKDIVLWGRFPNDKMPEFMENSNILVISLKSDPVFNLYVPGKLQSYLTAGRPILGIISGDVAKIIEKNELGFVADPSKIDCIADGFKYMSNQQEKWYIMGQNSRTYYEKNYNKSICINKIISEIS